MSENIQIEALQKVVDLSNYDITELYIKEKIPTISALILSNNPLKTLGFICNLVGLKVLHLDSCNLYDSHMDAVAKLGSLQCLILRNNNLQLLYAFNDNLQLLDVSCNKLVAVSTNGATARRLKTLIFGAGDEPKVRLRDIVTRVMCKGMQYSQSRNLKDVLVNYVNDPTDEALTINFDASAPGGQQLVVRFYLYVRNQLIRLLSEQQCAHDDEIKVQYQVFGRPEGPPEYPTDNCEQMHPSIREFRAAFSERQAAAGSRFGVVQVVHGGLASVKLLDVSRRALLDIDFGAEADAVRLDDQYLRASAAFGLGRARREALGGILGAGPGAVPKLALNQRAPEPDSKLRLQGSPRGVYLVNYFQTRHTLLEVLDDAMAVLGEYGVRVEFADVPSVLYAALDGIEERSYQRAVVGSAAGGIASAGICYTPEGRPYLPMELRGADGGRAPYQLKLDGLARMVGHDTMVVPAASAGRLMVVEAFRTGTGCAELVVSGAVGHGRPIELQLTFDARARLLRFAALGRSGPLPAAKLLYRLYRNDALLTECGPFVDLALHFGDRYDGLLRVVAEDPPGHPVTSSYPVYVRWHGDLSAPPVPVRVYRAWPRRAGAGGETRKTSGAKAAPKKKSAPKKAQKIPQKPQRAPEGPSVFDVPAIDEAQLAQEIRSQQNAFLALNEAEMVVKKKKKRQPGQKGGQPAPSAQGDGGGAKAEKPADGPKPPQQKQQTTAQPIQIVLPHPFASFDRQVTALIRLNVAGEKPAAAKFVLFLVGKSYSRCQVQECSFDLSEVSAGTFYAKFAVPYAAAGYFPYLLVYYDKYVCYRAISQTAVKLEALKPVKQLLAASVDPSGRIDDIEVLFEGNTVSLVDINGKDVYSVPVGDLYTLLPSRALLCGDELRLHQMTLDYVEAYNHLALYCPGFLNLGQKKPQGIFTDAFMERVRKNPAFYLVNPKPRYNIVLLFRGQCVVLSFEKSEIRNYCYIKLLSASGELINFSGNSFTDVRNDEFEDAGPELKDLVYTPTYSVITAPDSQLVEGYCIDFQAPAGEFACLLLYENRPIWHYRLSKSSANVTIAHVNATFAVCTSNYAYFILHTFKYPIKPAHEKELTALSQKGGKFSFKLLNRLNTHSQVSIELAPQFKVRTARCDKITYKAVRTTVCKEHIVFFFDNDVYSLPVTEVKDDVALAFAALRI